VSIAVTPQVGGSDVLAPHEILSVAIYETLPGREQDSLETMALLLKTLSAAGFSRDYLYKDESQYVLLRYWKSEEARRAAHEDPEVQRCWAKLGNEIRIVKVFEVLDQVVLS
jgi:heme-degrading monooxygenase HmoA